MYSKYLAIHMKSAEGTHSACEQQILPFGSLRSCISICRDVLSCSTWEAPPQMVAASQTWFPYTPCSWI